MTRDTKLYLEDIFNTIKEIEEFTKELSFDDFAKNTMKIRAVTMDFIIIGEAAKHLPIETRRKVPQIAWSKIIGTRNILTHEYPETDTQILWKTVTKRLPELKAATEELLKE